MTEVNHWQNDSCAKAFWDQHKALPYRELLRDTVRWLRPQSGERWLDLGCGGGQLARRLWQASRGQVAEVVAMDCAQVNELAITELRLKLHPCPEPGQFHFLAGNFSSGLPQLQADSFDGVVSGLAISYAESQDQAGNFTDEGYNNLLAEIFRVLKPGGRLVFSVNVPEPNFWRVFWRSLRAGFRLSRPQKVLLNGLKMQRYGSWLKKEARRGRFHYFPIEEIETRLRKTGFTNVRYQLSYADQAYVIAADKPAA